MVLPVFGAGNGTQSPTHARYTVYTIATLLAPNWEHLERPPIILPPFFSPLERGSLYVAQGGLELMNLLLHPRARITGRSPRPAQNWENL